MKKQDALVAVVARNSFYKQMHYLALAAFGLALLVIIALTIVLIFLIKNPTPPIYFATNHVGRLINIIPLDQPNMTEDDVASWAAAAVEAAYSYDYVNFRSQLQKAEKFFTTPGWTEYMKALKASNNLTAVQERKMAVLAKVVAKPVLTNHAVLSGRYAWQFKIPVLVTYQFPPFDQQAKYANSLEVTMTIRRENVLDSYGGLGIVQIVSRFATTMPASVQMKNQPATE